VQSLGLAKPVVLGSSFGDDVALAYAESFPDHPGGIILANTNGARRDVPRVIEAFGRVGDDEAAAIMQRVFAEGTDEAYADHFRVCYPLYSGTPGWAEESRMARARTIQNLDVNTHVSSQVKSFDPWSLFDAVRCPVLAGEDDPIFPLPVVAELASGLPAETTSLVYLPGARHTIFRDRPDLASPR